MIPWSLKNGDWAGLASRAWEDSRLAGWSGARLMPRATSLNLLYSSSFRSRQPRPMTLALPDEDWR
jgi:hypothetical protein